jgi:hypothetical protein
MTRPRCKRCKQIVEGPPRWKRFSNGSVHLVWWCCDRQVQDPIGKYMAEQFHLEPYEQAVARLTVEYDTTWATESPRLF